MNTLLEVYESNKKLLYKISWRFHQSTGYDIEEFMAEANLAFVQCYNRYDPSKGAFTTFVYTHVRNHLLNVIKNLNKTYFNHSSDEGRDYEDSAGFANMIERRRDIHLQISSCGQVAQYVLDFVIKKSESLEHEDLSIGTVKRYLYNKGFSHQQINKGVNEIKEIINV